MVPDHVGPGMGGHLPNGLYGLSFPFCYNVGWGRGHRGFVRSPSCSHVRPITQEDLAVVAFRSVTVTCLNSLTENLTKSRFGLISLVLMYSFANTSVHSMF